MGGREGGSGRVNGTCCLTGCSCCCCYVGVCLILFVSLSAWSRCGRSVFRATNLKTGGWLKGDYLEISNGDV